MIGRRRTRPVIFVFVVAVILTSIALASGTVMALRWIDTPGFCVQCHTMQPQFLAYQRSAHRSVKCVECHTGDGVGDFVRTKLDGTIQLLRLLTSTYQRPIPPGGHRMENGAESCQRCHDEPPSSQDRLLVRRQFQEDEENTEQLVVFLVKLADGVGRQGGIHWHVKSRVEFSSGQNERWIPYVRVTDPAGLVKEYVSGDLMAESASNPAWLAEAKAPEHLRRMNCLTCHNRVGHDFLSPSQALDDAMSGGKIDKTLPFLKKQGVELLTTKYGSAMEAAAAIGRLEDYYRQTYSSIYGQKRDSISRAVRVLRDLYGRVASPEMGASYVTYPSFLGHRDASGCFRCHDGAHFLLDQGRPTTTVIPYSCSLCHTFPQRSESVRGVMIGTPPVSHGSNLWIIEHGRQAGSLAITKTSCSVCHSQTYCTNCHSLGMTHANMDFRHAETIREKGQSTCTYCHQKASCLRCHSDDVWRLQ